LGCSGDEGGRDEPDVAVGQGTLPVAGSLDMSGTETLNGDGNKTISYSGTYTCDPE